jgi:A/G-specific adenine glycosylase
VPEKNTTFLLLMHGNDILLEKRPGSGIWGGLWCLPQFDDEQVAMAWAQANGYRYAVPIPREMQPFSHTFTHFKLHITPLLIHVVSKPQQVQQADSVWLDVKEALQAAIPTPVRQVLKKLS